MAPSPRPSPPSTGAREKRCGRLVFMPSEMANHGLGELDVIGGAHRHSVLMGAGLERQLELVDERVIEHSGDAEKLADGRLSADLAFGEEILERSLVDDLGVVGAQIVAVLFEV